MQSARDAILEADKAFEEAFFRGDADALSDVYADDADWLVPAIPPMRGRSTIASAWKAVIGSDGNRVRVDVHDVQECSDWAFDVGAFTATTPALFDEPARWATPSDGSDARMAICAA